MKVDPGIEIIVEPGVYDPREDSWLMISALEISADDRVLEIGCGSGIIALHCASAGARTTASDISPTAVECTMKNAERNSLPIRVIRSDLLSGIDGEFDVIIFNPPYLPRDETADDRDIVGDPPCPELLVRFVGECDDHLSHGGRIMTLISSVATDPPEFERSMAELGYTVMRVRESGLFFEQLIVYALMRKIDAITPCL